MNLKTCEEIEIETERLDEMLVIRERNQRKAKKSAPGGEIGM